MSGREFSVHRAVLAARWPRFYEIFSMRSTNSVVDVGDVEPEAFEKLLRCIYSNRNPSGLLKEDILRRNRDLVQTLEPSWLKEQISVDQEEISPSTTMAVIDLNEQQLESDPDSDSDSDSDDIPETAFSNCKTPS